MFQFRAFPSYTYLIQCMILEYCSSVLPHSEISGSTLICSSPKLFAACHVLHRLLMPRHSPCALISLTWLQKKLHSTSSTLRRTSVPFRFFCRSVSNPLALGFETVKWFTISGSLELCRFNRSCLTKLYLPFIKSFHNAVSIKVRFLQSRPLLPCFLHFPLFSFQGAIESSLYPQN